MKAVIQRVLDANLKVDGKLISEIGKGYVIFLGVKKGDKVAILLMNCLEWLPIYFGILKSGAMAVPLNFRYSIST